MPRSHLVPPNAPASAPVPATVVVRGLRTLALLAGLALTMGVLHGCAVAAPEPLQASRAVVGTTDTRLARAGAALLSPQGAPPGDGLSAIHLLSRGTDALQARQALIERAERSLDLQYYIWRSDASGTALAAALWKAAERGVRVRLLLDDWGARPSEQALGVLAAHPNVEVRLFNPLALRWSLPLALLLDFDRGNRRMHNKLLLADNQALVVGGRNIGDEYFERRPGLQFGDLDVVAFGPVVRQASAGFDRYWNHPDVRRVPPQPRESAVASAALADLPRAAAATTAWGMALDGGQLDFVRAKATAVQDDPVKSDGDPSTERAPDLGRQIASLTGRVDSDVLLVSPYFVPGEGGVAQLRALREAGVRVRVVTNSLAATDVPAVHSGYARYRRPLLEAGVEIYEIKHDAPVARRGGGVRAVGSSRVSLHAKLMVVDQRSTFVGSMNIDPRSLRLNTENGIVIDSAALAADVSAGVDRQLAASAYRLELADGRVRWTATEADGRKVHHDAEPQAGWWLRLQSTLLGWMPIEELL